MIVEWLNRILRTRTTKVSQAMDLPTERASWPYETPSRPPLIDADDTLVGEITRARRYDQSLSIVVVSPAPVERAQEDRSPSGRNGAPEPDVLPLLVAVGLREALRESDVLCHRPMEGQFVLGLPQSDATAAGLAIRRVGELFRTRLDIELIAGVADFPSDGLTLEDLVSTARDRAVSVVFESVSTDPGAARAPRVALTHRVALRSRARLSLEESRSGRAREGSGGE